MGWVMSSVDTSKPIIYNYDKSTGIYKKSDTTTGYYTWKTQSLWKDADATIKFINDTGEPIKITRLAIKSVACDSGYSTFYSSTGRTGPSYGYGGRYYSYIRVSNDGTSYQESQKSTQDIPDTTKSNMNSPGTSTTNTAVFGNPPYGQGNDPKQNGLQLHEYSIPDCPIIEPNGEAYVHFGMERFTTDSPLSVIRFVLNPTEMEIDIESGVNPYFWRFGEDRKWHLVKPLYIYTSNGWKSVEGDT